MNGKGLDGPFIFRLNDNGVAPHLLVQVCIERGWREYTGDTNSALKDRWNLWWKSGGFATSLYKSLLPWQFINRIPKGSSICKKDNLVRHLKCMRQVYGSIYDISPIGYNLPSEYTKLAADCSRTENDNRVWICKPVGQSQGRGIFLFRKLSDLIYDGAAVVQRYIEKPLLIGGYKFDLRLYVCVPSYRPLVIYLYNEGLTRFATEKFSLDNINDPFRHLTNFALNKLGPGYSQKKERIGAGSKWNFRQLRRYMHQSGLQDWFLWQRIACLVTLTILSQTAGIPKSLNCFEFFGFDVLIDVNLKPWLLEKASIGHFICNNIHPFDKLGFVMHASAYTVNLSPALGNDCEVDSEVKKPLLHDLFDLMGLPVCNTGLSLFKIWSNSSNHKSNNNPNNNNNNIDYNYCASKYYNKPRCSKQRCKLNSNNNSANFVNISSESFQRTSTHNYANSCPHYNFLCLDKNFRRYQPNNKINNNNNNNNNISYTNNHNAERTIWDNERDWNNPKTREGGWIRIYPIIDQQLLENIEYEQSICSKDAKAADKEIRNGVLSVQKFMKVTKDINREYGKYGDERCNELLRQELNLNTEIWLPDK